MSQSWPVRDLINFVGVSAWSAVTVNSGVAPAPPETDFTLGIITTDAVTHGWDLARATGQPTDLDPDLGLRA